MILFFHDLELLRAQPRWPMLSQEGLDWIPVDLVSGSVSRYVALNLNHLVVIIVSLIVQPWFLLLMLIYHVYFWECPSRIVCFFLVCLHVSGFIITSLWISFILRLTLRMLRFVVTPTYHSGFWTIVLLLINWFKNLFIRMFFFWSIVNKILYFLVWFFIIKVFVEFTYNLVRVG